ncbi:MAG: hypothetical protein KF872_12235 [Chitinophagales bacterium]|nr:hypothetical protein [Chitinophagales bacterium]
MLLFIICFASIAIGIWMGYFTRNASTTMEFFRWSEKRVMRVWLYLFIGGMLLTYALSQGTVFQLNNPLIPEDSADHFRDWRSMFEFSLAFFFLPLLVLANIYSLATKRINFFLYGFTFLYAAIFSYKNLQNLNEFFYRWESHFGLWKGEFPINTSAVWFHVAVYAFLCIFNLVFIWWGLRK